MVRIHRRFFVVWFGGLVLASGAFGQDAVQQEVPQPGTVRRAQRIAVGTGGLATVFDGIQLGATLAPLGDLDGDGVPDLAVGAPTDPGAPYPIGAVWVLFLRADGRVRDFIRITPVTAGITAGGAEATRFGAELACLGDLDGDGWPELAVQALDQKQVWVLFLTGAGQVRRFTHFGAGDPLFADGPAATASFAGGLANLGDLNGDGRIELALGDPNADAGGVARGVLWIVTVDAAGEAVGARVLSGGRLGFTGPIADNDHFGKAAARLGDLDGDGIPEIAVAASLDDEGIDNNGSLWILSIDHDLQVVGEHKISATHPLLADDVHYADMFTLELCRLGDLDGDGLPELAAGSGADDDGGSSRGAVRLLFLDQRGKLKRVQKISQFTGGFPGILHNHDWFGGAVAEVGDLDGDGVAELAVGSPDISDRVRSSGGLWILFLNGVAGGGVDYLATAGPSGRTDRDPPRLGVDTPVSAELRSVRDW